MPGNTFTFSYTNRAEKKKAKNFRKDLDLLHQNNLIKCEKLLKKDMFNFAHDRSIANHYSKQEYFIYRNTFFITYCFYYQKELGLDLSLVVLQKLLYKFNNIHAPDANMENVPVHTLVNMQSAEQYRSDISKLLKEILLLFRDTNEKEKEKENRSII